MSSFTTNDSFVSYAGQTVIIPRLFRIESYRNLLRMVAGVQISLDNMAEDVREDIRSEIEAYGLSDFLFPRVGRVLPAMSTIAYMFLVANRGRVDEKGLPIYITFTDILNIMLDLGLGPVINVGSLRVGFSNIVNLRRDKVSRQINLAIYYPLKTQRIDGSLTKGYFFK